MTSSEQDTLIKRSVLLDAPLIVLIMSMMV